MLDSVANNSEVLVQFHNVSYAIDGARNIIDNLSLDVGRGDHGHPDFLASLRRG